MSSQTQPTLYERLGGVYSIATIVDDFIDRVMSDARLNANPAVNEAHHKVPPAGFKLSCHGNGLLGAAGGPQKYTGRSMLTLIATSILRHKNGMRSWMTFSRRSTSSRFRRPSGLNCERSCRALVATSLLPRDDQCI
jgi:hypothetical protein